MPAKRRLIGIVTSCSGPCVVLWAGGGVGSAVPWAFGCAKVWKPKPGLIFLDKLVRIEGLDRKWAPSYFLWSADAFDSRTQGKPRANSDGSEQDVDGDKSGWFRAPKHQHTSESLASAICLGICRVCTLITVLRITTQKHVTQTNMIVELCFPGVTQRLFSPSTPS